MLQFSAAGKGTCRVTGTDRGLSVYAAKPADAKDLLLLSAPEEKPAEGRLSWPGEYDVAGVSLRGVGHKEGEQVSWLVNADGHRLYFPSKPLADLTDAQLQHIGDIDVLVVPAEDAKKVQKLVDDLDPRVLLLIEGDKGVDAEVLKVCGAVGKEQVTEYKLKGSLPAEGREVVVLTA